MMTQTRVECSVVFPEHFRVLSWWRPLRGGPAWFYHSRVGERGAAFLPSLATVDPPLRPIHELLYREAVPTFPSCAGHFPPVQWVRQMWMALHLDAEVVQREGLELENLESGQRILWQDVRWRVPWESPTAFGLDLRRSWGRGYIAFQPLVGTPLWRSAAALQQIEYVAARHVTVLGRPVIEVFTAAPHPNAIPLIWERVYQTLLPFKMT